MSTGTRDFVDDAAETLGKGRHVFVLLATDALDGAEALHKFTTRFGVKDRSYYRMLRELLEEEVIPWLREMEPEEGDEG